jgi:hypothetical protein
MLLNIRDVMKITSSSNMIRGSDSVSMNVLTTDATGRTSRVRHPSFPDRNSAADVEMRTMSSFPRHDTYESGSGRIVTLDSISPLPVFHIASAAPGLGSLGPGEYWEHDEDDADTGHSVLVIQ